MEGTTYLKRGRINNETIFEIGKFAILWSIFEDVTCNCDCRISNILNVAQKIGINYYGKYEIRAFETLASTFKERAKMQNLNIEDYVRKSLYPDDSRAKKSKNEKKVSMDKVIMFITSDGKEALEGALLAILRIRNNMFHGLKGYNSLNEQIVLFKSINSVLEVINP